MAFIRIAILGLSGVLSVSACVAQTADQAPTSLTSQQNAPSVSALTDGELTTYPDTTDGIKAQMVAAFEAYRSGDMQKFSMLLEGFALPNPDAWLADALGAEKAGQLRGEYAKNFSYFKTNLTHLFDLAKDGKHPEFRIEKWQARTSSPPSVPIKPELASDIESFHMFLFKEKDQSAKSEWMTTFFYDGGVFRYLGSGGSPFWEPKRIVVSLAQQVGPDGRIIANGALQAARLIHSVAPEYPPEAKKMHIEGTVHLHAVIGKDGSVKDLSVIDGDPDLARAAMKAVQQWRYEPTLLGGKPVEVNTTIAVTFNLNH
jgi:TonB family protein